MFITIIGFVIAAILAMWSYFNDHSLGLSLFVLCLVFSFIALSHLMISEVYIDENRSDFVHKPLIEVNQVNIKTIHDRIGEISGRFCLGSGTINSDSYYYFYVSENDSTSYLKKLNSNYVKIIETDSKSPCVIKYKREIDWENTPQTHWIFHASNQSVRYNWVIYVPKHTIIINYSLDAQ